MKLFNLSVGQYQLLTDIDPNLSIIEQNIYVAAAIKGITYDEASKIKLNEFKDLIEAAGDTNVKILEGLKINNNIILNGKKYHLEHHPDKLTSGQLLDIINIRSTHQNEPMKVIDSLLAAMCRPKDKGYGDDNLNLNERAALIRDIELHLVWNIFVFFWNLLNDYLGDTKGYLLKRMEETPKKVQQILDEGGDYSA
jgi:hypothetical protein